MPATHILPFRRQNRWGFRRVTDGAILVPASYSSASRFSEGVGVAEEGQISFDEQYNAWYNAIVFIDERGVVMGRVAKAITYSQFSDGLIVFERDGLAGYAMPNGQEVISAQFEIASSFVDGIARASLPGARLFGLIDKTGRWIVKPKYDEILDFTRGEPCTAAKLPGGAGWVLLNRDGRRRLKQTFYSLKWVSEGVVAFRAETRNGLLYGLMTIDGDLVLEPRFTNCDDRVQDGLLAAEIDNGGWGVVDQKGGWIIQPIYTSMGGYSQGLFLTYRGGHRRLDYTLEGGKFGFLNRQGETVIPFQFDGAMNFEDGYATVDFFKEECPALRGEPCDVNHEEETAFVNPSGQLFWLDIDHESRQK